MPTNAWKKANQKTYTLVCSLRSGIPAAIEQAAKDAGMQPTEYVRKTIIARLQEDGYLPKTNVGYSGPHGSLHIPAEK